MSDDNNPLRGFLRDFNFKGLFNHLGWDNHNVSLNVNVGQQSWKLHGIVHKRGVQVFHCEPGADGKLPDYAIRRRIETHVAKSAHEHLIVFADAAKTVQTWQWVYRVPGKPAAYREYTWHKGSADELLLQKLRNITFPLSEEEALTIYGVTVKLKDAFDREPVTKRFYDQFKKEHAAFLDFIKGIETEADAEWYASIMLNRLMFVYFIQAKGFLDGDTDYLRRRLKLVREKQGKDKFYSFYRFFLLKLFHEGLGRKERPASLVALLGKIPYLNGGIFEEHPIEQKYSEIEIPDKAFERIFNFLSGWEWHLDDRPNAKENEINPEVLGYIFEKYINQKQMGAYYTKEDITDYISKNTIIPFLFEAAAKECAVAFKPDSLVWKLLKENPDAYIYEAVRRGVDSPLPAEVEAGLNNVAKREGWNKPADPAIALPTETWREHVARRQRCHELRKKMKAGEITSINDLVTYNLDIFQFAQDVIEQAEGPELVTAFYYAMAGRLPEKSNENVRPALSVLDPTCGSGAFLFAALKILKVLYDACLQRMESFLADIDASTQKHHPKSLDHFRRIVGRMNDTTQHPSPDYFVLKTIILNNLYGVDLMEEAVEICKLRLFLTLVAQVDRDEQLEPLPDMDFNIRAGNTLVGFATVDEVRRTIGTETFAFAETEVKGIEEDAIAADCMYRLFRQMQTQEGMDSKQFADAKKSLRQKLDVLDHKLDVYLAGEYGINAAKKQKFEAWKSGHQPFHWLVEFYGIMKSGGFDVIIGNPPYVELDEVSGYTPLGYSCSDCGNLYALVMERCFALCPPQGHMGFIVPVSSISTDRYSNLQRLIRKRPLHYSSYDDRPSRLFDGLEHIRLTIHLLGSGTTPIRSYSTRYNKWSAGERPILFNTLLYTQAHPAIVDSTLPKLCSDTEGKIVQQLAAEGEKLSECYSKSGTHSIFYSRKVGYFLQVLDFAPRVLDGQGQLRPPSEFKELRFAKSDWSKLALSCLNSSLFYWFVTVFSDCRHVNKREVDAFPVALAKLAGGEQRDRLLQLTKKLMNDLDANSEHRKMKFKHDTLTVQCILPKLSKPLLDKIDALLAVHYQLSDEELDFIVNYDIKYRMGQNTNGEE